MNLRGKLVIVLFSLLFCSLKASSQDFHGLWEGELTQEEGGFHPTYKLIFKLKQDGKKISGISRVFVGDIYVEMAVEGVVMV